MRQTLQVPNFILVSKDFKFNVLCVRDQTKYTRTQYNILYYRLLITGRNRLEHDLKLRQKSETVLKLVLLHIFLFILH